MSQRLHEVGARNFSKSKGPYRGKRSEFFQVPGTIWRKNSSKFFQVPERVRLGPRAYMGGVKSDILAYFFILFFHIFDIFLHISHIPSYFSHISSCFSHIPPYFPHISSYFPHIPSYSLTRSRNFSEQLLYRGVVGLGKILNSSLCITRVMGHRKF